MFELLMAFGRAVLKIFISAVVGVGVGMGTMGYFWMQRPDSWVTHYGHKEPPLGEIFFGVGVGLLSAALLMLAQFYGPWAYRNHIIASTSYPDHPRPLHDAG
jgi:hypothetical protein